MEVLFNFFIFWNFNYIMNFIRLYRMPSRIRLNTRSFGKLFSFWNVVCVFWRVLQVLLNILYYSYQTTYIKRYNDNSWSCGTTGSRVVHIQFTFWGLLQCGCCNCGCYCFRAGCSLFGCWFRVTSGQFLSSHDKAGHSRATDCV